MQSHGYFQDLTLCVKHTFHPMLKNQSCQQCSHSVISCCYFLLLPSLSLLHSQQNDPHIVPWHFFNLYLHQTVITHLFMYKINNNATLTISLPEGSTPSIVLWCHTLSIALLILKNNSFIHSLWLCVYLQMLWEIGKYYAFVVIGQNFSVSFSPSMMHSRDQTQVTAIMQKALLPAKSSCQAS